MSTPAIAKPVVPSITRAELNALCLNRGSMVQCSGLYGPDGFAMSGAQLLLAMSGRESSFGANLKPRHEPAWDVGGGVWKGSLPLRQFIAQYGTAGACSYGPLQVMAFNCGDISPAALGASPDLAMVAAIGYLNSYVLGHWRAVNLAMICSTWNSGHPGGTTTPGYYSEVLGYYLHESLGGA